MTPPDPAKTIKIKLTPITAGGMPSFVDGHYDSAVAAALEGGDKAQAYFDARNQTAGFWAWMGNTLDNKEDPWAEGTDPQGHPILMASNGNLDMRVGAFWRGHPEGLTAEDIDEDDPPVVAIASIQTHNTTNNLSGGIVLGVGLLSIPGGIKLTQALFADLLKPVYANLKLAVGGLVQKLRLSAEVEAPSIDPEDEVEDPLSDASADVENIAGELAEEGAEYVAVEWGSVGAEVGGLAVLAAIPIILQFLAHQMFNTVQVINRTDEDFKVSILDLVHGILTVKPAGDTAGVVTIPKMDYNTDSWGDKTTVKVAYEANYQFANWSQFGPIGHVLGLTPASGGKTAKVLTWIPWAGMNTIWAGDSTDEPSKIWADHSNPDGLLSRKAGLGTYTVSMSTNKLSGETDGRYFYGVIVTIDKAS